MTKPKTGIAAYDCGSTFAVKLSINPPLHIAIGANDGRAIFPMQNGRRGIFT